MEGTCNLDFRVNIEKIENEESESKIQLDDTMNLKVSPNIQSENNNSKMSSYISEEQLHMAIKVEEEDAKDKTNIISETKSKDASLVKRGNRTATKRRPDKNWDTTREMEYIEEVEGLYQCTLCMQTRNTMVKATTHVRTTHPKINAKYVCDICAKQFYYGFKYNMHMKRHISEEQLDMEIIKLENKTMKTPLEIQELKKLKRKKRGIKALAALREDLKKTDTHSGKKDWADKSEEQDEPLENMQEDEIIRASLQVQFVDVKEEHTEDVSEARAGQTIAAQKKARRKLLAELRGDKEMRLKKHNEKLFARIEELRNKDNKTQIEKHELQKLCKRPAAKKKYSGVQVRYEDIVEAKTNKSFPCDICESIFDQNWKLIRHKVVHLDSRKANIRYTFTAGDKIDAVKRVKEVGINEASEELRLVKSTLQKWVSLVFNPLLCSFCCKAYSVQNALKNHEESHTNELDAIQSENKVKGHKKQSKKISKKSFQCDRCSKLFRLATYLEVHLKSCGKFKEFRCEKCPKSFTIQYKRNYHQQICSGAKLDQNKNKDPEFIKSVVQLARETSVANSSSVHKLPYTTVYCWLTRSNGNYACQTCHKAFPCESRLQLHMRCVHEKKGKKPKTLCTEPNLQKLYFEKYSADDKTGECSINEMLSVKVESEDEIKPEVENAIQDARPAYSETLYSEDAKLLERVDEAEMDVEEVTDGCYEEYEENHTESEGERECLEKDLNMIENKNVYNMAEEERFAQEVADGIMNSDHGENVKCGENIKEHSDVEQVIHKFDEDEEPTLDEIKETPLDQIKVDNEVVKCNDRFSEVKPVSLITEVNIADPLAINELDDTTESIKHEEGTPSLVELSCKQGNPLGRSKTLTTLTDSDDLTCCGILYKRISYLRLHFRAKHEGTNFPCDQCNYQAQKKSKLSIHKKSQHPDGVDQSSYFSCEYCDFKGKTKRTVYTHTSRRHPEKRLDQLGDLNHFTAVDGVFQCTLCSKRFDKMVPMMSHLKLSHQINAKFECETCKKKFYYENLYKKHKKIHDETREVEACCEQCGKEFHNKRHLYSHMTVHGPKKEKQTQVRSFFCPVCAKGFFSKQGLTEHEMLHNDLKSFDCSKCNKTFKQSSGLTSHKRRMHNESGKPFMSSEKLEKYKAYMVKYNAKKKLKKPEAQMSDPSC